MTQAQTPTANPWAAAEAMHRALFEAQKALLTGNNEGAVTALETVQQIYQNELQPTIAQVTPEIDAGVMAGLSAASIATKVANVSELAALRGQIYTQVLNGARWVVVRAVERGDLETARAWLLLREYRTTTRFIRPDADATLELKSFSEGRTSAEDTIAVIQFDLLDAYQAQLSEALADADVAAQNKFSIKLAEQAGLAAGYYNILAATYEQQNGAEAAATFRELFNTLVAAAVNNDLTTFEEAIRGIRAVLRTFRAAPLPGPEQVVRVQQIDHFIGLAAIEYGMGVRDGVVVLEFEIQETRTALQTATTAFTDIENVLYERGPELTEAIEEWLREFDSQVRNIADPTDISETARKIKEALGTLMPNEFLQRLNNTSNVDIVNTFLSRLELTVGTAEYASAESARIQAYQLTEARFLQQIRGYAPDLARRVDLMFWQGQSSAEPGLAAQIASQASAQEVGIRIRQINEALTEADTLLELTPTGQGALPIAVALALIALLTLLPKQWRSPNSSILFAVLRAVLITAAGIMAVGVLVRALQINGTLPISPVYGLNLPIPFLEATGIFPTLQGMLPQLGVVVVVYVAFLLREQWLKRLSPRLSRS